MRTTMLILGLLLVLTATACKRNTDSGRQYSELPDAPATMSAPAVAPPTG